MNRRNPIWWVGIGGIIAFIFLGIMTFANYRYAEANPGGNKILVHWQGTRLFLTEGLSPYSDEAASKIQALAISDHLELNQNDLRAAYPLYSIVLFFPFSLFSNFTLARAFWMTLLEVSLIGMTLISIRLVQWRPSLLISALLLLFSVLWYHAIRPLVNGNDAILIGLAITGAFLAIKAKADEMAGVLLAFTTIKPQLVIVLIIFIIYWAVTQRRYRLITWLIGTVIILSLAAALLMPDWILQNIREIVRYPPSYIAGSLGAVLATVFPAMGHRIGQAIGVLLGVVMVFEWWRSSRKEFRGFLWTACLTLVVSQWIGIQTEPDNFIVLFPGLVLVFAFLGERWKQGGAIVSIICMVLLFAGIWAISLTTEQFSSQPVQSPILFIPLPAFLLVTLYWVRWWAVQSRKLSFSEMLE